MFGFERPVNSLRSHGLRKLPSRDLGSSLSLKSLPPSLINYQCQQRQPGWTHEALPDWRVRARVFTDHRMRPVLHSGMNEINHCQETGESRATSQAKNFLPPRCGAACQSCRPSWQPLPLSDTSSRESSLPNWALSQLCNLQSCWPWKKLPRTPGRRGCTDCLPKPRPVNCLHRTFRILSV